MKKWEKWIPFICVFIGGICSLIALGLSKDRENITTLFRPALGDGSLSYELEAVYGDDTESVEVSISERKLTFEEAQEVFSRAYDEILKVLEDTNGDLDKVSKSLYLPESVFEEAIEVTWQSSDNDYIYDNGELAAAVYEHLPEEGMIIIMCARVELQDYSAEFEIPVYLSEKNIEAPVEDIKTRIERVLAAAEKEAQYDEDITLPSVIEGEEVWFYEAGENDWWSWFLMGILVAVVIVLFRKHNEDAKKEEKLRQLELSYAPIIMKFTLLVSAGSSIKGAWEKLVSDYRESGVRNAAYEEMRRVHNEMKNGMPEQEAYALFGKRCRLSVYTRFGNLLEQNLRKGTKGLTERLEQEVWAAFENRKALAMKLGEEAGTKLIFPMIMLLGIVIVICVVPAFLNM